MSVAPYESVVIVGGAGFIGGHLVGRLRGRNDVQRERNSREALRASMVSMLDDGRAGRLW